MEASQTAALIEHLEQISDLRIERTRRHKLIDILVIAVCATICGAEAWTEMEEFGEAKEEWLRPFLELPHGIPSHDTSRRVCMCIKPSELHLLSRLGAHSTSRSRHSLFSPPSAPTAGHALLRLSAGGRSTAAGSRQAHH